MSKLDEYSAKRRFEATPEPPALPAARNEGPLMFVVQQHSARQLHYDFRLECDGVLLSWAVPKGPSLDPAERRLAVRVEDHPYDYGSFEGVIPPGQYGAGEVIVWDCGVYSPDGGGIDFHDRTAAERRVRAGLDTGKLSLQLRGSKLKGSFALVRTRDAKSWLLLKHRDRFATTRDVLLQDQSVLSGVPVEALKSARVAPVPAVRLVPHGSQGAMPKPFAPMLAQSVEAPFDDPGWTWEPKLDGYRVLAYVDADGVRLRSRRGLELASAFPQIVAELRDQAARGIVIDGELVAFADGRPSFNALQNRTQARTNAEIAAAEAAAPTALFAFDLLHFEGIDLRRSPYADRRRYLEQCLLPSARVRLVHAGDDGEAMYEAALASGFEGVVGKRRDAAYEPGRRVAHWLKVKPGASADFVIGGWTRGNGAREALGALLVGYHDDAGGLRFASHVGSGFDERSLALVHARLHALRSMKCPFAPRPQVNGAVTWTKPELVAEVAFQSLTPDGSLRAPVFVRLRDDVDPATVQRPLPSDNPAPMPAAASRPKATVAATPAARGARPVSKSRGGSAAARALVADVLEQLDDPRNGFELAVGPERIRLTHLDRVYWPADKALKQRALCKRDLLRYLTQASPLMLPHLADRPLTMIRMPDGIEGQRFFQKHWEQARPAFTRTVEVYSESKDERHDYLVCNDLATLLWLAQSGTLEFHVWHSRTKPGADAASKSIDFSSSLEALEASVLNYPDWVVFDIDPYIYSGKEAKGAEPELNTVAFEKGKEIAFALHELLTEMHLEAIVKTSGKTGLHVFVPIRRTLDFDAARHVSELVSRHLMQRRPREITMEWSVRKRTGKIFMDHNMNVRGKTLNVAWSPRGVPGAPVSMPLRWDELAAAHPLDFTITSVVKTLIEKEDPWAAALDRKQDLARALDATR